ncbi:MAG: glycosyltransferase family 4 protein [Deferrisomatales bacterium]|nr:glycosyltransferase family 4 protein [Deferrisomatales bacterium]
MRILLIHQAFVSPGEAGGTRHFEFGQRLAKVGHDLTIIASDRSYITGERIGRHGEEEVIKGVRVLRAYTHPNLHRSFVWRVFSFLTFMVSSAWKGMRAGPVDVVMGTSPPIFQAVSAWVIAALRRRPFLLEIRDLWPEFAVDLGVLRNPVLIYLSRRLESFLYRRATHILVNSPAYRDYLVRKGVPDCKVSLIANGVDPDLFDPEARGEELRARWNLGIDFVATYAGALGLANDIPTILRAAARLRDEAGIRFLLVGDGKERPNLERMAAELSLGNVTFTGAVPKSQIAEVLAASDACLATLQDIPMFRTTYPNKVFDYMAAGRPTVLAIDGVIRELVEACKGGLFVTPSKPELLADAVLQLARAPERARAMGRAARRYVAENFHRDHQARQFVELVERLAQTA